MLKRFLCALLVTIASGCASSGPPMMYEDKQRPLSNTSVFSSWSEDPREIAEIKKVDGIDINCAMAGCPLWVRVTPGKHVFTIRYNFYVPGSPTYLTGTHDLEIPDMKAKHVYVARFQVSGNTLKTSIQDLGENPNYTLTSGLKGVNQKSQGVLFE